MNRHQIVGVGNDIVRAAEGISSHEIAACRDDLISGAEAFPQFEQSISRSIELSPLWLRRQIGTIATSLAADNDTNLSDATFMNFLQFHNHRLGELSEVLHEQLRPNIQDYKQKAEQFINLGIIPQSTGERLKYLDDMRIIVDDGYLLGRQEARAATLNISYDHGQSVVVAWDDKHAMPVDEVLMHEFTHVIAGDNTQGLGAMLENVISDQRQIPDLAGALDEALTDHIAQIFGGIRNLENIGMGADDAVYRDAKGFLYALAENGKGILTMAMLVDAYFGDYDRAKDALERMAQCHLIPNPTDYIALPDYDAIDAVFYVNSAR